MLKTVLLTAVALTSITASAEATEKSIAYYQHRYPLANVFDKLVDNKGNGFEPLYGTRNFRTVLNGVVYRGGANNRFHRDDERHNSNPLPGDGIQNLCEEGFGSAVYLYSTNYETAPRRTTCRTAFGANTFEYEQASPLSSQEGAMRILEMVHDELTDRDHDPIYLHCWNGWHASGYISALILRQFCGWTGAQAVAYWDRNTDGHNESSRYESIRKRIRAFTPREDLPISSALRRQVCPSAN